MAGSFARLRCASPNRQEGTPVLLISVGWPLPRALLTRRRLVDLLRRWETSTFFGVRSECLLRRALECWPVPLHRNLLGDSDTVARESRLPSRSLRGAQIWETKTCCSRARR